MSYSAVIREICGKGICVRRSARMRSINVALVSAGVLAISLMTVSAAQAAFSVRSFGGSTSLNGQFDRQAASHPDLSIKLTFPTLDPPLAKAVDGEVKTIKTALPPGLLANPTAAPRCTSAQVAAGLSGKGAICPIASQVGVVSVFQGNEPGAGEQFFSPAPVYNMFPPANLPALLEANLEGALVKIEPTLRGSDYGVTGTVQSISQAVELPALELTLWGVPAAPSHDALRVLGDTQFADRGSHPSFSPELPFVTIPGSCPGIPTEFNVEADSWQEPGIFSHSSFESDFDGTPFIFDGCGRLRFEPSLAVQPILPRAGEPTGLNVDIHVPQSEAPTGLATADVRKTRVTLPPGMTVSSSSAAGLGACSTAQIGIGSVDPPTCPNSSKIGTVQIKTPLLTQELEGSVILAKQRENPFGSLLALYLSIKGPGFFLKLPGKVEADPQSGQLTATFDNTPQLPFEDLQVSLNGGPAAPLVAPNACGTYNTHVEMTSWASSTPVQLDTPMTIDEGCNTGGFNPVLKAGTVNPIAGSSSAFNLQVTRNDGEQNISSIQATLPEGVLAKLKGVPVCPDAQAATGDCPAASQVGTTTVGAGAGPNPIYVPEAGKAPTAVYLAGPYKGAPYSLVVKVPAQAGPFDLGTVTVRNGLYVDPITTQVTAKSDPLPQILEGIPLTYRDIRIEINRNDFTINPTSCEPMKVAATIFSAAGASATPSARFQVADCEALAFKPKLALRVFGKTNRNAKPRFRAVLTTKAGEANIGRAQVNLPHSEFLEQAHIKTICTRVQFNAGTGHGVQCPKGSIYGQAKAFTPLLDKPLQGPVYLRSSSHKLPDLVAALNGQIDVELAGKVDSGANAGLRNTFEMVPDAPVSKFILELRGGKKGLLVNSENLCSKDAKTQAIVRFTGQNGKVQNTKPKVANGCGAKKGKANHK